MRKRRTLWLVVAATTMAVTACSSSANSSPAPPASNAPSSADSVDSSASTSSSAAAAAAAAKAAETFPTTLTIDTPLPSAPPKGKTIVFLQCEQEQCPFQGQGEAAAAAAIGWHIKVVNYKASDPSTVATALKIALQYHPVAAFLSGVPESSYASEGPAYAAAGAFISPSYDATTPSGTGIVPGRVFQADASYAGKILGDAVAAAMNGTPADSLVVNVPDYAVFGPTEAAYRSELAKYCPTCSVSDVKVPLTDLLAGKLNSEVVSAAERDPNLKYIVSVDGSFIQSLPAALKSAGLAGKYKIFSGNGDSGDQKQVLSDPDWIATINTPLVSSGWYDVDMAIRHVMGLPIPQGDHRFQYVLLTKSNIGTPRDSYDVPSNYAELFKKLWHVG